MQNISSLLSIQNNSWIEKNRDKGEGFFKNIEFLSQKFSIPDYFSKLLVDNEIDTEEKFINFCNPTIYFLHPPFLFKDMNTAIQLLYKAKEKDYPVFIFGDSDIDGIVGIKILYDGLLKFGIKKIFYSIPENDEPYGISIKKIDIAINKGAKLIITVDNGISSIKEIEYAKSKDLDVIITDHHNPQEDLPPANAILNPKIENYPYPLCLSGSGVAWKLIEALIFSQTKIFNQNIFFFNLDILKFKRKNNEEKILLNITFFKLINLKISETNYFSLQIDNDELKIKNQDEINQNHPTFSIGKIYNKIEVEEFLKKILHEKTQKDSIIVSNNLELLETLFSIANLKLDNINIKTLDKLVNQEKDFNKILETYKLYYIKKIDFLYFHLYSTIRFNYQKCINELEVYLPYVAIATIADIMPVIYENRYIISKGLELINSTKPNFITNILSNLINVSYPINTYDIIWKISPLLNAPGRFGRGEILLNFFLSKSDENSLINLKNINDYNIKRTMVVEEIYNSIKLSNPDKPIIFIEREGVEPGLTGLLSAKFVGTTSKPIIFITKTKNGIYGSMRSKNNFNSFKFLNQFSEYFENFGGHYFAAGFTIIKDKYDEFIKTINENISKMPLTFDSENIFQYNCEITFDELVDSEFSKWYKLIQPFGEEFKIPIFFSKNISLSNPVFIGRNNTSIKLKVFQDNISFDALFFKNKQFMSEIKLNTINAITFEPYFMQNNTLTLLIQDIFSI